MAAIKFTETRIARLRHDPKGPRVQPKWDSEITGLGVNLYKTGKKSYIFKYRIHGKQRTIALGRTNELSLSDAGDIAIGYRALIKAGADPKVTRDAPTDGMTLDQLFEKYTATRYYKSKSGSFHSAMSSTYRKYLQPELGHYPVQSIQRTQIRGLVDNLIEQGKEGAARGLLNRVRILLNYAIQEEIVDHSPADKIRPKYTTSGKRTDWLDSDEKLREAWWFTGPTQARALIRWALLTGCRRDEARTTRHAWITDQTWTVPKTKNTRELVLPMMPAMRQVADEMQSTFGATHWLFPATTDTQKALPAGTLDYMIRNSARKEWSLHTLRHTVETYLRELEIPEETRDLILNHVRESSGHRYSHGKALDMKRKALQKWHKHLLEAVGAAPVVLVEDNVIQLNRESG